jgi:hypothetical protein
LLVICFSALVGNVSFAWSMFDPEFFDFPHGKAAIATKGDHLPVAIQRIIALTSVLGRT